MNGERNRGCLALPEAIIKAATSTIFNITEQKMSSPPSGELGRIGQSLRMNIPGSFSQRFLEGIVKQINK